ncbi:MAG: isoleucine--tRNA ligase [Planctomycetota bacterium]|nr:isoleucine--tRNA ligase [Planctomycetota bacterium]
MFQPVETNVNFPEQEERILNFWRENKTYDRALSRREGGPKYVFYEGPPTANGKPHPGHCLTRAIKDLFPRYRTMRGFYCERKAGWDTHGLPVEVEVCKELGIHSKEEIEAYGIEPFIQKCQQSVWQYMQEWEQLTERLGFWVKLDDAYVTYHQSYVESVWWSLKDLFDRDLLYQGHKIIWWWAQGGTALSSGEVGQGYKTVFDPSVYVLFPLLDQENTSLLVWTTTPWTLPSNQFAAVNPELEYATVYDSELGQNLILARDLVETISEKIKRDLEIKSICKGTELVGQRYRPPFDYYYREKGEQQGTLKNGQTEHVAWRITAADFVTTDSGSGAVHEAPAFGEVDYELLITEQARFEAGQGPELICAVGPNGQFTDEVPDFSGMWVKDADKPIMRRLKEEGKLYLQEQYQHEYPFCWRADDDPLIQYPRRSWFIRTTHFRDAMLANNQQINWLPAHIRDGRFGNFLESNVDWALSRERYWGTPLPIWVCSETGKMEAVGSYEELLAKPGIGGTEVWEQAKAAQPELPDDLRVHKPYIDHVTYDSPHAAGARMKRVAEVIDCWYDSGAMPFAQWGYPHQNAEQFRRQFPADFISEALDQTRGWFYSLLAISTMMFSEDSDQEPVEFPHPYRNCIVLGLMLGEDGQKMSKSKRNYREPREIFDRYGADALRWYFFANQPPWTAIRYREQSIKESIPEFILRLWNVYSFFVLYANIDGFSPIEGLDADQLQASVLSQNPGYRPVEQRGELDRWIISELNGTIQEVTAAMDAYDNFGAANRITAFVDAMSNWYVRRSRDRFWAADKQDPDKLDAYWTLFECLATTSKMVAPFVPFVAEAIWQNLVSPFSEASVESVHLCDYPTAHEDGMDRDLSRRMKILREIASLGRSARMDAKLKVRQPLAGVTVVLSDAADQPWLEEHGAILQTELNVKAVQYTADAGDYVSYQVIPNFKRLGPRVGKLMPAVKKALAEADGGAMLAELETDGKVCLSVDNETIELDSEDIQVRLQAKEGWAAAQGQSSVVILATDLTEELVREGMARDAVRLIQDRRKELDLQFTDRIRLWLETENRELHQALSENGDYIASETLATEIQLEAPPAELDNRVERTVADSGLFITLQVVESANT